MIATVFTRDRAHRRSRPRSSRGVGRDDLVHEEERPALDLLEHLAEVEAGETDGDR